MKKDYSMKAVTLEDLNLIRRFSDVRFNRTGDKLYWLESIDGQGCIFQHGGDEDPQNISGEYNVRGTVGYGGGEFDVGKTMLVFAEKNGGLFKVDIQQQNAITQITPSWSSTASPVISPDEQWVLYAYQQGETDGLAIVRMNGLTWPIQLVLGADFYMQPAWHPSGDMIAWSEWNHPHMPWEASCVKVGKLHGMQIRLKEEDWIGGGAGAAASQPRFSPDGKWLSYIQRDGDWDSLILYDVKKHTKRTLLPADGCHLCMPNWIQGMRSYAWGENSRNIYYFRYLRGITTLWKVNLHSGKSTQLDIQPVTWATQIDVSFKDETPAFMGISPMQPKQIWVFSEKKLSALVKNDAASLDKKAITEPKEIVFQTDDKKEIYGIYFAPGIPALTQDGLPPLILDIHGGPSDQECLCYSSKAAYFTSRGYAYAQINYRGSSGYGYDYLEALRHSWGVVDVEDTKIFAQELVKRKLADPSRLILRGSSAGGFTALNTLIQEPGLFRAAICSYAVSNLVEDAQNTHKFERFYHRFLTGNLETDRQRFIDRSPAFNIEKIKDPVALFHGDSDKVVSKQQSIDIYTKLTEHRIPCLLKIYEGEGHGFRKAETVQDFYRCVEVFLKEHLGEKSD